MTERRKMATTAELAAYLDIPAETLRDWRTNGTGPNYLKIGKHVRYRWSDIDKWEQANLQATA